MMSKAVQIKPVNKCWRNIVGGVMYMILLLGQIVIFYYFGYAISIADWRILVACYQEPALARCSLLWMPPVK